MGKIFLLSFANIRKTKGHTVSLFIMFIIAALLLNAGLLVFINFGSFFDKVSAELNASDVYYIMPRHFYGSEEDEYIKNNNNISASQKEDSFWATLSIPYNGSTREFSFLLNNAGYERQISKWKFVGEHLAPEANSIYLPYVMNIDGGYKLNDKFILTFGDKVIEFTIKGFTEDVFFSSLNIGVISAYLPSESFENVSRILGNEYNAVVIFANLNKKNKDVETGLRKLIEQDNSPSITDITKTFFSLDLPIVKLARIMMSSGVSVIIVAFAAIIFIICLIVVRFRINNSIEDDMAKIGSLKAVGYTGRQIILSVAAQFLMIAVAGCIAGVILSYLIMPVLSDVFAHQSGLKWIQGIDCVISSLTISVILLIVLIVALFSSRRIHKLNPIVALRGGIITHNFRKNHLPLYKAKGCLPFILALKSMLLNMKQSIMLGVIFIAISFISTFSVVMFYNTTVDTKTFAETPGIELSNVIAVLNPDNDNTVLIENIKEMNGVRKVQFIDQIVVGIDNYNVNTYIMDDFSLKETNTVYTGRYPLHSNEIVLDGYIAEMMQKNIGDIVTVNYGGKKADYLITGFSQGANMGGMNASVRSDGFLKLSPDFKQQTLNIYLNKEIITSEYIKDFEKLYGQSVVTVIDMDKSMEQGMGIYTSIVSKVGITMLIVTVILVALVLYFVINSLVIRKKRELGIQKAIGFTTFQLMNQLSLNFLPSIVIGVFLGSIIGITETNAIMSVAQRAMGIMKANYIITPVWIALSGAATIFISYITSLLITYRIRQISAYELAGE